MNLLPNDLEDIVYDYIKQLNHTTVLDEFREKISYKLIPVTNIFTGEIKYNSELKKQNMIIKYSKIEKNKKILHIMNIIKINSEIIDYARFIPY